MLPMFLCCLHWGLLGFKRFYCIQLPKHGVVALRLAAVTWFPSLSQAAPGPCLQSAATQHLPGFRPALMLTDAPCFPLGVMSICTANKPSASFVSSWEIFITLLFLSSCSSTCPEWLKIENRSSQEMTKKYFWHNKIMLLSSIPRVT